MVTFRRSRLFEVMHTVKVVLGLSLVICTGCISLSVVPRSEESEEPDASTSLDSGAEAGLGDARAEDAERPEPADASAADAAMAWDARLEAGSPCGSCDGSCEQGRCVPVRPPTCVPGVTGECLLDVTNSAAFMLHRDMIYWIDRGTTDAFNNPRNDGKIYRTRVGAWSREVVLDGLDFYDDGARRFLPCSLWVSDNVLVWNGRYYLSGIQTGDRVRGELDTNLAWCLGPKAAYAYRVHDGELYVIAVDRFDSTGQKTAATSRRSGADCRVVGDYLYSTVGRVALQKLDVEGVPTIDEEPAPTGDLWSNGRFLFVPLADGRIGMAPDMPNLEASRWTAITRPGRFLHADQDYIYSTGDYERAVYRVRLDGSAREEKIATLMSPEFSGAFLDAKASSAAVYWPADLERTVLHVVPLSASAPMQ